MLWTVFKDLPFEERLAKVAEAGYNQVELVGEYRDWQEADFARANVARKRLGIRFDATAGMKHGVGDPGAREAFLEELNEALKPMETLSCPAMIVLSGNVVPGLGREAQHESCVETLKRAAALVEGRKIDGRPVRLLLECIHAAENPKYFLTSAAEGDRGRPRGEPSPDAISLRHLPRADDGGQPDREAGQAHRRDWADPRGRRSGPP